MRLLPSRRSLRLAGVATAFFPAVCLGAEAARPAATQFYGRVVAVQSGNRLEVMRNGRPQVVQIYGLEVPQGPYAVQSERFLQDLALGRGVNVRVRSAQRRPIVGELYFVGSHCLAHEMIKAGMARWHRGEAPHEREMARLEAQARAQRRGAWADSQAFVPPKPQPKSRPAKAKTAKKKVQRLSVRLAQNAQ